MKQDIKDILEFNNAEISKENANLNGRTTSAKQSLIAGEALKSYAMDMLDEDVRALFEAGLIHIHDFDHYALGTLTCTQIKLSDVLKGGFTTNGSPMREANSITVAMAHAAIAMQANQNQQHGGQAFPNWDFDLAPYVERSYQHHFTRALEMGMNGMKADEYAHDETEKETMQAAEAFVHNMNTMNGSRGGQSVFSSLNFGLDTSWEGRLIIRSTLTACINGLGDGHTAIYPILIFKLMDGVNMKAGDPNYDLFKLAQYSTSKRLFPNYQFCDATFNVNHESDDPRDTIATMGCRTRTFEDIHGITSPVGRGNASFTTMNLPMIAKVIIDDADGFDLLPNEQEYVQEGIRVIMDLCAQQLWERFEYQKSQLVSTFDFVFTQGSYTVDEEITEDRELGEIIRHSTLSIGFIGLAEAMMLFKDAGYNIDAYRLVEFMRVECDRYAKEYNANFSLLATPSEGFAEKSMKKYVETFGEFPWLEDHKFFTNSFHVPVWENMSAKEKIEREAPYHALCNAGHISYVELSAEDAQDLDKVEDIILYMADNNMGYASINVPVDRCMVCAYDKPIEGDRCPRCSSPNISRVRRITGYLVGTMDKWNTGKADEERRRVKHGL